MGGLEGRLLSFLTREQSVKFLNNFFHVIRKKDGPQIAGAVYNKYMQIINDHTYPDEVQQGVTV